MKCFVSLGIDQQALKEVKKNKKKLKTQIHHQNASDKISKEWIYVYEKKKLMICLLKLAILILVSDESNIFQSQPE